eukprot:1143312-Rhodomonas_salina.4
MLVVRRRLLVVREWMPVVRGRRLMGGGWADAGRDAGVHGGHGGDDPRKAGRLSCALRTAAGHSCVCARWRRIARCAMCDVRCATLTARGWCFQSKPETKVIDMLAGTLAQDAKAEGPKDVPKQGANSARDYPDCHASSASSLHTSAA